MADKKKIKNYIGMKCSIQGPDDRCLSIFFLIVSIILILTICTGREFQIFMILLKKKHFLEWIE